MRVCIVTTLAASILISGRLRWLTGLHEWLEKTRAADMKRNDYLTEKITLPLEL